MTRLTAEAAALVAEIHVAVGDAVAEGTVLISTELMKMRHDIRAPHAGVVEALHVALGDELARGTALLELRAAEVAAEGPATAPDHAPQFEEFQARRALLEDAARPEAVAKRHAQGLRTARENIDDLFDDGSFQEYGAFAVAAQRTTRDLEKLQTRTQADGIICGVGRVNGRAVAAMAVD